MTSRSGPDGASTADADRAADDRDRPSVCSVCQQPFDRDVIRIFRGEPVHVECSAELRCGIRLGGPTESPDCPPSAGVANRARSGDDD